MVEGPKVVMKVKRIYSLKGQVLQAMIVMPTQSSSQPLTGPMSECIGMMVQEVWCLGKELFLNMTDPNDKNGKIIGIKLHFGMAGSERLINTSTLSLGYHLQNLSIVAKSMLPKGSRKKWTTCLIFNQQALFTYDSTITTKTANYLEKAFQNLHLDVMSYDKFNPDSVIQHIRAADQSRHIHEVIMDQNIFPGVGNVIKIEGLIDARIHPHSITSELNDERLKYLIKKLKDYARYWYDCGKGPGPVKANRKHVYGRSNCGICSTTITLIRDGVYTYICSFICICMYLCMYLSVCTFSYMYGRSNIGICCAKSY